MTTPNSIRFTDADRDDQGFVSLQPPQTGRYAAPPVDEAPPAVPPIEAAPIAPEYRRPLAQPPARAVGKSQRETGRVVLGALAALALLVAGGILLRPSAPGDPSRELPPVRAAAPAALPAAPTAPAGAPAASNALIRAVVAYSAPDGAVLGPVEAGRTYTPVGRWHLEWTQIDAPGSGRVWVAAADVTPDPTLPDLAPLPTVAPAPRPVIVAPAPAPAPPAPCTAENAAYRTAQDVSSPAGVPLGRVVAWSCVSQLDSDAQAGAMATQMQADHPDPTAIPPTTQPRGR